MTCKARPLFSRLIVFAVPEKRRIKGSGLYQPNAKRGLFSSCQDAWIVGCGPDVMEDLPMGTRVLVADAFELEPTDINLWEFYEDRPEFEELRDYAREVDGDIVTQIVVEDSLLAVVSP